ncbi:MAG: hypothetical protein ACI3Y0_06800 [Prevotella sp.]
MKNIVANTRFEWVLEPSEGDFVHGYMVNSGFCANVLAWHGKNPSVPLRFFWDKKGENGESIVIRYMSRLAIPPAPQVQGNIKTTCERFAT